MLNYRIKYIQSFVYFAKHTEDWFGDGKLNVCEVVTS